ncbi:unnamed protein product [Colias eurytheme]|nr:unnamed protein product [Colias eurytheme]
MRRRANTNKSYQDAKTEVRCTVLFVWREVEALIQTRERLCWRGPRPGSLPLQGALCGRTYDRHPRAAGILKHRPPQPAPTALTTLDLPPGLYYCNRCVHKGCLWTD